MISLMKHLSCFQLIDLFLQQYAQILPNKSHIDCNKIKPKKIQIDIKKIQQEEIYLGLNQSEGKLQRKCTSTICQHNLIDAIAF